MTPNLPPPPPGYRWVLNNVRNPALIAFAQAAYNATNYDALDRAQQATGLPFFDPDAPRYVLEAVDGAVAPVRRAA